MIKVKKFKDEPGNAPPQKDDYIVDEKKAGSILPAAFLVFLVGCAAYLKSFLPISRDSTDEANAKGAVNPDRANAAVAENMDADPDPETTGSTDQNAKSSDNVIPITARFVLAPDQINNLLTRDSPLDFSDLKLAPLSSVDAGPISEPIHASNDNRSAGGGETSGKASGGGGGGGGRGAQAGNETIASPVNQGNQPPVSAEPELRNRAPRVSGSLYLQDLVGCHAYLVSLLLLLRGATDPDGDPLQITNIEASSGTLVATEEGWSFVPDKDMRGDVTLSYTISDGRATVQQTAIFSVVEAPPIIGTDHDDNLIGTHCGDTIDGGNGNDNIDAREGNDLIVGGDGDDHILGGAGNDVIHAGYGDDVVFAGAGNDIVLGGAGNDRLFGEDGDDILLGEDGADLIAGGGGVDLLRGGNGDDLIQGDAGNDTLEGGDGNDVLFGGGDADVLIGDAGDDLMHGESGNDLLAGGVGNDTLRGGDGADTLMGDAGNDVILGDDGQDTLSGGDGVDEVHGGSGDDLVIAALDSTSDTYAGDAGNDTLDYSSATVSIVIDLGDGDGYATSVEVGMDLISGFENVIGGLGDDYLSAGSKSMTMTGGEGNDTFAFEGAGEANSPEFVRKITDFTVGDRLLVASYEIRYREGSDAADEIDDLFDDLYLSSDVDNRPVRFRFEKQDDEDRTFVDVLDSSDSSELYSIELYGHHPLSIAIGVT
ncbi:MAG: cadherin-like domain-containing protein [Nitrobacter sp.]